MTKTIQTCLLLTVLLLQCFCSYGQKKKRSDDWVNDRYKYQISVEKNRYSFEEEIPYHWQADEKGSLELSDRHYKAGKQSLKWSFSNNAKLRITAPHNLKSAASKKQGGFMFWIYNEKAIEESLHFSFTDSNDKEIFDMNYKLNFIGWRAAWVKFTDDLGNSTKEEVINLVLTAPKSEENGNLYFDSWEFVDKLYESRSSSYQFQRKGDVGFAWSTYRWSKFQPDFSNLPQVTTTEKEAFATIQKRLDDYLIGTGKFLGTEPTQLRKKGLNKYIAKGIKGFEKLNIKRHTDGHITGTPLFARNSPHRPLMNEEANRYIPLPLAFDYLLNGNKESLEKLFLYLDFVHDQGWAEGSGLGTLDHETLRSSSYVYACYLIRNELKQTGRLERELATMRWFLTLNMIFSPHNYEITADNMRTRFMFTLLQILMMPNSSEKVAYMRKAVEYYNFGLDIKPGWGDVIKDDFTGYHHRNAYGNGYSPPAYSMAAQVNYLLHNTEFKLSDTAVHNLRQAVFTMRDWSNLYYTPAGVGGRLKNHDTTNRYISTFMLLAMSGDPIDMEMAQAFMRLWNPESPMLTERVFSSGDCNMYYSNTIGEVEKMQELAAMNIKAENAPVGFWHKPYAAVAFQRRDNWMASVKGYSKYIWDFESGGKNNIYGRYISYGALQILSKGEPVDYENSGYALAKGWDWNRWPGATTIHTPFNDLRTTRKGKSRSHRNFSKETFVGGTGIDGTNGMYAFKLHDRSFNPGFEALKTYFFFDNQIICLGSGISNHNNELATETTLFQTYMKSTEIPIRISGKTIDQFPFEKVVNKEKVWISDPCNNYYLIPDASNVIVKRQNQSSWLEDTRKQDAPTHGDYSVAYFDHGKAPKEAEYEYMILIDGSAKEASKLLKKKPYKVIQKDEDAHIILYKPSNTIAYAIQKPENFKGLYKLKSISAPAMLMTQKEGKKLVVSVCDPDFRRPQYKTSGGIREHNIFEGDSEKVLIITLNGAWNASQLPEEAKIISKSKAETVVEVVCSKARTYQLEFKK